MDGCAVAVAGAPSQLVSCTVMCTDVTLHSCWERGLTTAPVHGAVIFISLMSWGSDIFISFGGVFQYI